jgi:hypothetical protein
MSVGAHQVNFEFLEREWPLISGAPVLAIALVIIAAFLGWLFHGIIHKASMEAAKHNVEAAKQRREMAEQKVAELERQISELETRLSARQAAPDQRSIASLFSGLRHTTADLRDTLGMSAGPFYVPFGPRK